MKECFHFTKNRYLKNILEQGLQPKFGTNCSIIGDRKGAKISYSIGQEEAEKMFTALYEIYFRIRDGRVNEEGYDDAGKKNIANLQKSESFEAWEEPGVYLTFDGEWMEKSNNDESKLHDSYTDQTIPPEQLKVCIIKNKKTGEIISSKYDVACFWIAKSKNVDFSFYYMKYKDRIQKFKSEEFEMDYIDLSEFYEKYFEKAEEKLSKEEEKFPDKKREEANMYRAILNHYGFIDIARDLSDEVVYDFMYRMNLLVGEDYGKYYNEYKNAEKDEVDLKELKERYVLKTKKLLEKSGYNEQQIEEKISQGYANKIIGLHCWAGGLQCIFEDFRGPKEQIEKYIEQLEVDMKEGQKREISISEVGNVAKGETITNINNAINAIISSKNQTREEPSRTD